MQTFPTAKLIIASFLALLMAGHASAIGFEASNGDTRMVSSINAPHFEAQGTSTAAPPIDRLNWLDPYQRGLKAIDARKWEEAVADLEQAVAADPKAEE